MGERGYTIASASGHIGPQISRFTSPDGNAVVELSN
jgi:hypothetical protein